MSHSPHLSDHPLVSVIIPAYNCASFITRTINSVIDQTFSDWELIVVNDASADHTEQVVQRFTDPRIRYLKHQHNSGGPPGPKNTGLKAARGRYVALLDHDDQWLPEKLEKQLALFSGSRDVDWVSCFAWVREETGEEKAEMRRFTVSQTPLKDILRENFILSQSSLMVKRAVLEEMGGFDNSFREADDWDLYIRLMKDHRFSYVPEPLYNYYLHDRNTSVNFSTEHRSEEREYLRHKHRQLFTSYLETRSTSGP